MAVILSHFLRTTAARYAPSNCLWREGVDLCFANPGFAMEYYGLENFYVES
jgi:hypothetical protein